jgi:hypothetical protein
MTEMLSSGNSTQLTDAVDALVRYRHTAVEILMRHDRLGATCRACQAPWPCSAACAAENVLEW